MRHDLVDRSILGLGHLEENDDHRLGDNHSEHQKHVGLQDDGQIGKREREHEIGNPVGEHANGESSGARVLSEALGHVQERYGSETDGKAHDEHDDAHDAQVGEENVAILQVVENGEQDEVEHDDDHRIDEEWLAAQTIDERYAHECHDDVDEAGGEHGVLNVLVGDVRSLKDALRIEKDLFVVV